MGIAAPSKPIRARPLGDLVTPALGEAARAQGFAAIEILTRWAEIAGEGLAGASEPVRIIWPPQGDPDRRGATLVVRVEGTHALDLQFAGPVVIERINRVFGWKCVARLALRQGPVARRGDRPVPLREPDPALVAAERAKLSAIEDEALKESLARLGAHIRARRA